MHRQEIAGYVGMLIGGLALVGLFLAAFVLALDYLTRTERILILLCFVGWGAYSVIKRYIKDEVEKQVDRAKSEFRD